MGAEPVIRLDWAEACVVITAEEYEAIERDLVVRAIVDEAQPGDWLLAKMLLDVEWRYREVKAMKERSV